jgi:PAS domain S-box-containing protein
VSVFYLASRLLGLRAVVPRTGVEAFFPITEINTHPHTSPCYTYNNMDIENLEVFQLACDHVDENVIITDAEGVILYANRAMHTVTGHLPQDIIGQTPALWGKQMGEDYYTDLWKTIKHDKLIYTGDVINIRKNGELYNAKLRITPVLDAEDNVRYFIGVERDTTKDKELEKVQNEFISIASHQLRTPMTGIKWVIERFTKKEDLTDQGVEYLQDIHTSTTRLSMLVDVLLNASRIEGGRMGTTPKEVEVVETVAKHIRESQPIASSKGVTLSFSKNLEPIHVVTDMGAFRNILQSLISNAIEYTPAQGTVDVSVKKSDETFTVTIKDSGIGIPAAAQESIFKKFTRAENAKLVKTDGTGLGLFIAKRATRLLDGKIWFVSKEGEGTTFYVELPLHSHPKAGDKQFA